MTDKLIERLGDVLDIIAAAEHQFARTPEHHDYYSARHKAVSQAADRLTAYAKQVEEKDAALRLAELALPVLRTMLHTAGLTLGVAKADETLAMIRAALETPPCRVS